MKKAKRVFLAREKTESNSNELNCEFLNEFSSVCNIKAIRFHTDFTEGVNVEKSAFENQTKTVLLTVKNNFLNKNSEEMKKQLHEKLSRVINASAKRQISCN